MNKDMRTETAGYPFVVEMSDEVLSLPDIERHAAEAKIKMNRIDSFRAAKSVANLGACVTLLMCFLVAIGVALSSAMTSFDDSSQLSNIYKLAAAFIAFIMFVVFGAKSRANIAAIGAVKSEELILIDSDPESCAKLTQWINEYDTIKVYVGKISAKNRLPTFAEFHCIERWVTQKQNNKPVDNLKEILNLGA